MSLRARPTDIIARLVAYDPGHDLPTLRARWTQQALIELGSNENSDGPSPAVRAAVAAAPVEELFRYPDPMGAALRRDLATRLGVEVDEVVLGNGSHELLMLLAQCYAAPGDEVVFSEFGFAVFPIATAAVGATPRRAAALSRQAGMPRGHDLDAMAATLSPRTRLVYLANPNNPTGTWFGQAELVRFLQCVPAEVPVVLDEAYHEYVTAAEVGDSVGLRARFPNLVIARTFSKAYGLAGLRLGYAIADRSVIATLNSLRESFNANALAQLAARVALDDGAHVAAVRERTAHARDALSVALRAMGLFVHPSQTNFVLIDFDRPAAPIEARLLQEGVVVRPMGGYGLPTCLRISVGNAHENAAFLAALAHALT
jgi:histidinol-phosphate aminotransferase